GLMVAASFAVTLIGWSLINPKLGPKGPKSTWMERFAALPSVLGVVIVFLLTVGGLMYGIFTPSEAGSVGTIAVLILTLVKKDMDMKRFARAVMDTLRIGCMVMMLLAGATVLGHFFAVTRTPFLVATWLESLNVSP